mmetsp:Transcript_22633/g.56627  ORF Transcript_22633/g.56627 Transcript_22633/m.56627 type:complete len:233 (+) Transcript_22633:1969-2667(+)
MVPMLAWKADATSCSTVPAMRKTETGCMRHASTMSLQSSCTFLMSSAKLAPKPAFGPGFGALLVSNSMLTASSSCSGVIMFNLSIQCTLRLPGVLQVAPSEETATTAQAATAASRCIPSLTPIIAATIQDSEHPTAMIFATSGTPLDNLTIVLPSVIMSTSPVTTITLPRNLASFLAISTALCDDSVESTPFPLTRLSSDPIMAPAKVMISEAFPLTTLGRSSHKFRQASSL